MQHTVKAAWIDTRGRRHNIEFNSDTADRRIIKEMIQAQYPADPSKPGDGVIINAVMGDQNAIRAREAAHRQRVEEQNQRHLQWQEDQRNQYGQINSSTTNYNNINTDNHYGGGNTAALWALGAGATVLTAKGLWWGGKTAFKGVKKLWG